MTDMLTVLAQPATAEDSGFNTLPNLGLFQLAGALRSKEFPAQIVDGELSGINNHELAWVILQRNPAVVGLSTTHMTLPSALEIFALIKTEAPEVTTVVGGCGSKTLDLRSYSPTSPAPLYTKPNGQVANIDFVVTGSGHFPLLEIVKGKTTSRGETRFIDGGWDMFPRGAYPRDDAIQAAYIERSLGTGRKEIHIVTSTGCPGDCGFCTVPNVFTPRSKSDIEREIAGLCSYQPKRLYVFDDNPLGTLEHGQMLCQVLKDAGVKWLAECRVQTLSRRPDLIDLMADSGCATIEWGIESLDPLVQRQLGKIIPQQEIKQAIRLANERGMRSNLLLMSEAPGESGHSWDLLEAFLISVFSEMGECIEEVFISRFGLFPGTPMWHRASRLPPVITQEVAARIEDVKRLCRQGGTKFTYMAFAP